MRKFQYVTFDELGNDITETISEDDIRNNFFPHWKKGMEARYPKTEWKFEDCLCDWKIIHWAWEVK